MISLRPKPSPARSPCPVLWRLLLILAPALIPLAAGCDPLPADEGPTAASAPARTGAPSEPVAESQGQPLIAACGQEFVSCLTRSWPGGRVPYAIHPDAKPTRAELDDLLKAMKEWQTATGGFIKFERNDQATDAAVLTRVGGFCQSPLGYSGARQDVPIVGCGGAIAHELGHLLGLAHQNSRGDRDRHIRVSEQIYCTPPRPPAPQEHCPAPDYCGLGDYEVYRQTIMGDNIRKCGNGGEGSDYGAYDFASIMHYSSDFPSANTCAADSSKCGMIKNDGTLVTNAGKVSAGDGSAILEKYAEPRWSRFKQVASQQFSFSPYDTRPKVGVEHRDSPAMARWGTQGVVLVRRGSDAHLYAKMSDDGLRWPTAYWTDLGGDFSSDPAAVSRTAGQLDVVAVGSDGNIWRRQLIVGRPVGAAEHLGRPPGGEVSAPAITSWGPDRLDIFVRSGNQLYRKSLQPGWTDWKLVPGSCCVTGKPAAVSWGVDRIDLAAVDAAAGVWHAALSGPGAQQFSGWGPIGGQVLAGTSPAIASAGRNHLNIYVTGSNGRLWLNSYDNQRFGGFGEIGGLPNGSPAAAAQPSRRAHVAVGIHNGKYEGTWHRSFF